MSRSGGGKGEQKKAVDPAEALKTAVSVFFVPVDRRFPRALMRVNHLPKAVRDNLKGL